MKYIWKDRFPLIFLIYRYDEFSMGSWTHEKYYKEYEVIKEFQRNGWELYIADLTHSTLIYYGKGFWA